MLLIHVVDRLRFQDLRKTRPTSLSLTEGVLRAVCVLSKTGQRQTAACLACGFTSHSFSPGWGYTWFEIIQEWIQTIRKCSPDFNMDFIFPEVQGEGLLQDNLLPRPML